MDLNILQNWLRRAACSTRGEVDAARYKDYILPLEEARAEADAGLDKAMTALGFAEWRANG